MTTLNIPMIFTPPVVYILIVLGVLWRVLDVLYVSVTSQVETGEAPEGGNTLADVTRWIPTIFKLPAFSRASEHQLEVPSVPETSGQAFELPELDAAGGPNTGSFQNFLSRMVGVQNRRQAPTLECNPSEKEHLLSDVDLV